MNPNIFCSKCNESMGNAEDSDGCCDLMCCEFTCMKCIGEEK